MRSKYIDDNGLIHPRAGIRSEYGILFRAYLDLWDKLNGANFYPKWETALETAVVEPGKRYQSNPPERGSNFSRANMTGLYCLRIIHGLSIKDLPLFEWNNRTWIHPSGWAVYLALKYSVFRAILWPLINAMAIWSLMVAPKEETNDLCLWFLTLHCLNYKFAIELSEYAWAGKAAKKQNIFRFAFLYCLTNKFHPEWDNRDNPIIQSVLNYYGTRGIS